MVRCMVKYASAQTVNPCIAHGGGRNRSPKRCSNATSLSSRQAFDWHSQRLLRPPSAAALPSARISRQPDPQSVPESHPYTPEPMPAQTTGAPGTAGAIQRFAIGEDIPAQWWRLFRSAPLDELIRAALLNSPTLVAAEAVLRQAQENYNAEYGSKVAAERERPVQRGARAQRPVRSDAQHLHAVQRKRRGFLYGRHFRRGPARSRSVRRSHRLPALPARSRLPRADREPRDDRDPGSLVARPDQGAHGSDSGAGKVAGTHAQAGRPRRNRALARPDAGRAGRADAPNCRRSKRRWP